MDTDTILLIVSAALAGIGMLFGGKFLIVKTKLKQLASVVKEGSDVMKALDEAGEDNKITAEEWDLIKKEASEAWAAVKLLLGIKPKE